MTIGRGGKVSERKRVLSPRPMVITSRALQGTQRSAPGGEVAEGVLLSSDHKSTTHQPAQRAAE